MKTRIQPNRSINEAARTKTTRNMAPTPEEICQRAHEISRARGGASGNELEDWLRAEQQLKREHARAIRQTLTKS